MIVLQFSSFRYRFIYNVYLFSLLAALYSFEIFQRVPKWDVDNRSTLQVVEVGVTPH